MQRCRSVATNPLIGDNDFVKHLPCLTDASTQTEDVGDKMPRRDSRTVCGRRLIMGIFGKIKCRTHKPPFIYAIKTEGRIVKNHTNTHNCILICRFENRHFTTRHNQKALAEFPLKIKGSAKISIIKSYCRTHIF